MRDAQRAGRATEAKLRRVLGSAENVALDLDHGDAGATEGDQSVYRRRARPQWRRTEHEGVLQLSLGVVQECLHQSSTTAEAAKDCALAHTCAARDGVHGDGVDSAFGHEQRCGVEQKCPVTCGVAALGRLRADLG